MGRWFARILALMMLALVGGCFNNGSPNLPIDLPKPITSIDQACQALSVDQVNTAMGTSDIKLLVDRTFRKNGIVEIGRECGYLNKNFEEGTPSKRDVYGFTFTVRQLSKVEWDLAGNKYWEKVDAGGDEAYYTFFLSTVFVRHGDWFIGVSGIKTQAITDEDFKPILLGLTKQFVSQIPRS